jgi:hypothetical protein
VTDEEQAMLRAAGIEVIVAESAARG